MMAGSEQPTADVVIATYDLATGALYEKLMKREFDVLVLDEAHKLKNKSARRTVGVFGERCDRKDGLASRSRHTYPLSGTPAPNHPGELWTVIHALFPQAIMRPNGSPMPVSAFEKHYCKMKPSRFGDGFKIVGGKNKAELREKLKPYFLRRKFADTYPDASGVEVEQLFVDAQSNLDELREIEKSELCADLIRLSQRDDVSTEVRHQALKEIDKKVGLRLRRLTGIAKVPGVVAWAKEYLDDRQKLVLFGHHTEVLDALCEGLAKYKPLRVSGGVSGKARAEAEHLFRSDPARRVFVGNLISAGEGIDLSVADDVVLVESSWVPGENEQACRRIVNLMKKRENIAWFATLAKSIDEQIQRTNARKTADLLAVFG
jgi:SWI/SNF-related matrix-associated actin-dependent regulator of chromatin subfamily A-like protein 1